ncbi:MAG: lysylphosphatidylglycerol synthase transmembrane domain-containing protein [Candidatus Zixiibacteriota bacterium]
MGQILKYKRAWGIAVAAILLYLSFHDLDREKISDILSRADYWMLIPAAIAAFAVNLFKALRWRVIMDPVKSISVRQILSIFSVSQMVNVSLPALTGQAARVLLLSKRAGLPKTYCATTIVLEVLFDGISLVILMLACSTVIVFPGWLSRSGLLAGITLVVLLTLLLLVVHNRRKLRIFGRRRLKVRYPRFFEKIRHVAGSFADALDMLKSTRHTFLTALFSVCLWASHALVIVCLFKALGLTVPIWGAIVILAVNSVLLMFPITPGNLGTFQWACVAGMALFHVGKSEAVSFSIVLHVMDLVPVFMAGLFFLYLDHMRYSEIRDEALKESAEGCKGVEKEEVVAEGE